MVTLYTMGIGVAYRITESQSHVMATEPITQYVGYDNFYVCMVSVCGVCACSFFFVLVYVCVCLCVCVAYISPPLLR